MNLLVLGAGGMVGHVLSIKLAGYGHGITGFELRSLEFCKTIVGDAMTADWSSIAKDYDAVINCIGVLNKAVDAEADKGIWLNSYFPHLLAKYANRVIHISTDCVFSGKDGIQYDESSFRSTDNMYGRSKALGELEDNRNLTIRTSVVGPDINTNGIGLFQWFMNQSKEVGGYTHAIWSGVTTNVLADAVNAALEKNTTGLLHLTNGVKISKYELLKLFNTLRLEPVQINPSDKLQEDKSFKSIRQDFGFTVPSYVDMVKGMGKWIIDMNELYPQYDVKGRAE